MSKIKCLALVFIAVAVSAWAGTITVTAPRAGDVLCRGRAYPIRWTSSGVGDRVMVQIIRSSGVATYLTKDTKNSGQFDYTVPATISEGNYTVAVMSLNGKVRGESRSFRIDPCLATPAPPLLMEIAPSITVTHPVRVDSSLWVGGSTQVYWTTRGRVPDLLNISLHPPGCTGDGVFLSTAHARAGRQRVRFPATLAQGDYSVKVEHLGGYLSSISGCGGRIHLRRDLVVTEPNSRTVWRVGDSVVVRWRRESPFLEPNLSILVYVPIGTGFDILAWRVSETACEARVTVPNYPGRVSVGLSIVEIVPTGPESDEFQIVAR